MKRCLNKLQGFTTQGHGFRQIKLSLRQQEIKLHHYENNHAAILLHIQAVMFNSAPHNSAQPPLQGAAQHAAELTSHPNNFLCCRLWLVWQELTQRMPVFNHSKFLLRRQEEGGMSNCQTMLKEMQKSSAKIRTHRLQVQICLPKHWLGVSTRDDLDQTHLKQYSGFSALSLQIYE